MTPNAIDALLREAVSRPITPTEVSILTQFCRSVGGHIVRALVERLLTSPRGCRNLISMREVRERYAAEMEATRDSCRNRRSFVPNVERRPCRTPVGFVQLTDHAVERYRERIQEGTLVDAERLLWADLHGEVVPIRERTYDGQEQWLCASGAVLVVKQDDRVIVVVTVLDLSQVGCLPPDWERHQRGRAAA